VSLLQTFSDSAICRATCVRWLWHRRLIKLTLLVAGGLCCQVVGGCGGYYTVVAGDHIAATDAEAPAVVRLLRNDFFVLNLAVKKALIRFGMEGEAERAAYTDNLGYAGAMIKAGGRPGRQVLMLKHTDLDGDEIAAEAAVYVFDPARPAIVVALDDLPMSKSYDAKAAQAFMKSVADRQNVIYLTRRPIGQHEYLHSKLLGYGYPDGPILLWQRERWHIVRDGKYRIPRVVVETRLISRLPELRKALPNLRTGICGSLVAAKAFQGADLKIFVVGPDAVEFAGDGRESWDHLRKTGI